MLMINKIIGEATNQALLQTQQVIEEAPIEQIVQVVRLKAGDWLIVILQILINQHQAL